MFFLYLKKYEIFLTTYMKNFAGHHTRFFYWVSLERFCTKTEHFLTKYLVNFVAPQSWFFFSQSFFPLALKFSKLACRKEVSSFACPFKQRNPFQTKADPYFVDSASEVYQLVS